MKILLATTISLLVGMALLAKSRSDEKRIFPYKVNKVALDNGLTVISIPFDSPGLIAYYTVVRTGSRNEVEPGHSGFAHFFEHMMFRGTEKYPSEKYHEILKELGADSNAFTSDDWTAYHMAVSAGALETIIELESDRFMNLKYSEESFKTEAGAVLGEYNKNYSDPLASMFERLRDEAYTVHTYKHTTMGFLRDIQGMPNQYNYSLKFFDRFYRPENSIIVVVGDFNQERLIFLIKKYYGPWKRGSYKVDIPVEPPQKEEKVIHMTWKNPTLPYILIGYHVPAFSDTSIDFPTLDVLSKLVFSPNAPLYQKLVLEKQFVESIQGYAADRRDPSLFTIVARIKDPKNVDLVRDEIYAALEEAKAKPIPTERLEDTKSNMKYSLAMQMNSPDHVAGTISHYLELTDDPETINRVYALFDKVSAQDIIAVAKKYFTRENRTVLILTEEAKK